MKKVLISVLLIITMLFTLTACNSDNAPPEKQDVSEEKAKDAAGANTNAPEGEKKPNYKETMVPYDQLPKAKRIIMLQNSLNFSREGFYTADSKPVTEEIEYQGKTVTAYSMSYPLAFLTNESTSDIKITKNDGSSQSITYEDFAGLYVLIDFTSDAPPVFYNPKSGTEITDFLFATTEGGEAIYSVVSDSIYNAGEVIASVGWDTEIPYRFIATDKFHIPVQPAENAKGEIRGALSGAINASFPDMQIAGGKLNDLLFIQPME
ncbi:MAG: hypothetical protein ACOYJ1_06330 [Peptococcales bacterium]|jgi:hypothetical protein